MQPDTLNLINPGANPPVISSNPNCVTTFGVVCFRAGYTFMTMASAHPDESVEE